MRVHNLFLLLLSIPLVSNSADHIPTPDTFGRLLEKQMLLMESEMEAKIRANQNQGALNPSIGNMPTNATPLLDAKQDFQEYEPILEAIWGIAGQEVAELNYKGQHVAVSMQEPYISRIDGWKLESITPFSITLLRMDGKKIIQRKSITLDWGSATRRSDEPLKKYQMSEH